MGKVYYYGKKTQFVGKTLFEVLANLRNFGINRMLIKQEELIQNPGHKCYYIVKKVEPIMDDKLQEGAIYAERVYRNARVPGLVFVEQESWHTDWQLIPRDQEALHRIDENSNYVEPEAPPRYFPVPPLMSMFLKRFNKTMPPIKI